MLLLQISSLEWQRYRPQSFSRLSQTGSIIEIVSTPAGMRCVPQIGLKLPITSAADVISLPIRDRASPMDNYRWVFSINQIFRLDTAEKDHNENIWAHLT